MNIDTFTGPIADLPVGVIIPWYDDPSEIQFGWVICDGNNGTPDLTSRFPKGISNSTTDPGGTGGSNSFSISESQLPPHDHGAGDTDTVGKHYHGIADSDEWNTHDKDETVSGEYYDAGKTVPTAGSHSHTGQTNNLGGGSGIDNQPTYKTTHFIKRII